MDEQIAALLHNYERLRTLRDSRQISPEQFLAEMQQLHWRDPGGAWWMVNPNGMLLRHDGQRWQPVTPPPAQAPAPTFGPPPPGAAQPAAQAAPDYGPPAPAVSPVGRQPEGMSHPDLTSRAQRFVPRALLPLLPLIPSLLCGGLWFLYTFIGVFKSEGLAGVDWLTPMIVIGMPLIAWLLKRPLDRLLLPLKPSVQALPKALRLGICLAMPVVLGLGCSTLSGEGYGALRLSALISIVTAMVLLRY